MLSICGSLGGDTARSTCSLIGDSGLVWGRSFSKRAMSCDEHTLFSQLMQFVWSLDHVIPVPLAVGSSEPRIVCTPEMLLFVAA